MLDRCDHDSNPNCAHWRWEDQKSERCIHDEDSSCFHCTFNRPYLMKGIDPEPPKEQKTVDYQPGTLWVENDAVLSWLENAKRELRFASGWYDWDDDVEYEPDPVRQAKAQKEVDDIIAYIKEAQRLKEMEWNHGRFK